MPSITIGTNVIQFPDSGSPQDWSQPVIAFAQAVAAAISSTVNAGDVLPNSFIIDAYNPASNQAITGLLLNPTIVRGALIRYAVYRQRDAIYKAEYGQIFCVYNANGSVGAKWTVNRDFTGDAGVTFAVSDLGQVSYSSDTISGVGPHAGKLSYASTTFLQ